ncbi:ABC transporter substrate-binding protein [Actinoallomurus bryophytorum]|uniref:ABC-type branched-subunit amino acid transport system substrate-binding protein n=1 Tax=Actinoallomurus bryophytorum TaxID=1490222 RepID=A0A543CQ34_9ACTN|nr:ABC transporter substrate-binding protein [Actinoallomurus bryophytorum]TQL99213.1 ABC-type branched-subunit amino acid transport system substrate-binding protein [Actinoallomurus bryophytorum]
MIKRMIAGLAAMTLVVAGCGSGGNDTGGDKNKASAPGITATTVTIGSHQPLTGPAAPGYSEISPASKAYFDYVNANGGINGRKIVYKYVDDVYNPTTTVDVVHRLVLQDKVFAIFNGLGTPTHTKVVDYLNAQRVPDLFVASGCGCWDQAAKHPYTFGWQTDYIREGKILGQYIKQNFAGKKVAYFYQNDDFGQDGVKGLDMYIPKDQVVKRESYQPTNTDVSPQAQAIASSKADVVVLFSIPAFTALFRLASLKLGFKPQLAVSNVGSDPTTLSGLLESFAKKGGAKVEGNPLIQGIITDSYASPAGDTANSWTQLFKKIHATYIPKLPFDGNVTYGMSAAYTFVQALKAAGRNPTRKSLVDAVEKGGFTGAGLVPFAFSKDSHAGYAGAQIGKISGNTIVLSGTPLTTDDGTGAIQPYTTPQPQAPANGIPAG